MKLTVLVDNSTLIDRYYLGEPALAFYLEDGAHTLLFDTGYSDVLLRNAALLGVDLGRVDTVAISHGHVDHTGGLPWLERAGLLAGRRLVAHPAAFYPKHDETGNTGATVTEEELARRCTLRLTAAPLALSEHVTFLGEIPRYYDFEGQVSMGTVETPQGPRPDGVVEDTALACATPDGLFIVTGCSHSGICNIIRHAQQVCGEARIAGVIGGMHLFDPDERLAQTIATLGALDIPRFYPCHCVSLAAKCAMSRCLPVEEIGVGTVLEF